MQLWPDIYTVTFSFPFSIFYWLVTIHNCIWKFTPVFFFHLRQSQFYFKSLKKKKKSVIFSVPATAHMACQLLKERWKCLEFQTIKAGFFFKTTVISPLLKVHTNCTLCWPRLITAAINNLDSVLHMDKAISKATPGPYKPLWNGDIQYTTCGYEAASWKRE